MSEREVDIFGRTPVELHCSVEEFIQGVASPFWRDMKAQIEAWLEDVRVNLEDPDNIYLEKTLRRLAGNAEAMRHILILPEVTLANLEDGTRDV